MPKIGGVSLTEVKFVTLKSVEQKANRELLINIVKRRLKAIFLVFKVNLQFSNFKNACRNGTIYEVFVKMHCGIRGRYYLMGKRKRKRVRRMKLIASLITHKPTVHYRYSPAIEM